MSEPRFRSDRATMLTTAAVLGIAAAVLLFAAAHTVEGATTVRAVAAALAVGAVGLVGWSLLTRRAETTRRDALDKAVDDEMGRKWAPGFAAAVGAYDKPWYVLAGEPGVGKTAALRAGRLPMAMGPGGQPVTDAEQGKQGTYLFDWWFFQDAVVLDSAGDLIAHADDRWAAFLGRVRAARPHRPVNGMLLAVSAADLIAGDEETLREKAALLAKQVRVAREQLRVRFPLYLLVTKADLIPGFADFFPTGSDLKSTFQILGWSDDRDPRRDDAPVMPADVRRGLDGLVADLRRRRTAVESHSTSGRDDADRRLDHLDEMFAFPSTTAAALAGLAPFVAALLEQVNVPDAAGQAVLPPFFRGVYLTSALRTGEALDAELAKAFGTALRPTARRAASDRAFFIRDLLLEKIVPEAGMVAPLTAVPAAAGRRSRLIAAAAAVAAIAVVGGTLIGYRRTVARARADRDFWDALASVPADQLSDRLALFDPAGTYRGDAAFDKRTVLATYERSADLARADTASPLLPASAALNRDRRVAHADLFRQLALVPALVPGPFAIATKVSPEAATTAVLAALTDTRSAGPVPVEVLRDDAAALVPLRADAADRRRVLALLANGPGGTVTLSAEQRRRIADGAVAWVTADLAERRQETSAVLDRAAAVASDTTAVAAAIVTFEQAVRSAEVPEDLVEPVHTFNRAVTDHLAAGDGAALEPRTTAAAVTPPAELKVIGAAVARLGDADADVRRRLANAVLGYTDFLAAHPPVPASVAVREQQRPTGDRGTPLVVARADWLRAAAERARDAVAAATTRPAAGPPALALPALLRQLDDDAAARRRSFAPLSAVDPTGERDADAACGDHLAALAEQAARDAVWTQVRPADNASLWPDEPPPPLVLSTWISAQSAVESASAEHPPSNAAAARRWVAASHDQLGRIAAARLAAWRGAAGVATAAPVQTWADVGRLLAAAPATRPLAGDDAAAVAVLRRQTLFPDLARSAESWAAELAASPASAGRAGAIRAFLADHGFGRDAVDAVRARLVADPVAIDALARLSDGPAGSGVEAYWRDTLARSVAMLSDAARRQAAAALADLHAAVAGRYPLTADGTSPWDGTVDDRLRAGLALADAGTSANPLVRQIEGADAVTPAWRRYLSTLSAVAAFAQRPPAAWTVTFRAPGAAAERWAAVAAGPAGGEPENWHRFGQHRGVPLSWPMIAGGLAVRVSHDAAAPATAAVAALPALAQPWGVYRLAVGEAVGTDDANAVTAQLDRHGDPAVAVVPAVVPTTP